MNEFSFGHPTTCTKCQARRGGKLVLVAPDINWSGGPRATLVGQDPAIAKGGHRVQRHLMSDKPSSQLQLWLRREVFGDSLFGPLCIYQTSVVKCREEPRTKGDRRQFPTVLPWEEG